MTTLLNTRISNSNADAFSRLLLPTTHSTLVKLAHVQVLQVSHINSTPMESKQIRIASINDLLFSHRLGFSSRGCQNLCPSEELKMIYFRSTELTSKHHGFLSGLRVVVPTKHCNAVLNLLNESHILVMRMKGLARFIMWWPGNDKYIEQTCA